MEPHAPCSPPLRRLLERYPALEPLRGQIAEATANLCACARVGGTVLVCGNGGSAADAEHIVGELMKSFVLRRPPSDTDRVRLRAAFGETDAPLADRLQRGVRALALGAHGSLVTAIANDTDARLIFAQQVYVLGRPGDVLLAISTSGNSPNVVLALKTARALGLRTIGLGGAPAGAMDTLCDVLIKAPADETIAIQEFHLPIYHAFCLAVEEELFGR